MNMNEGNEMVELVRNNSHGGFGVSLSAAAFKLLCERKGDKFIEKEDEEIVAEDENLDWGYKTRLSRDDFDLVWVVKTLGDKVNVQRNEIVIVQFPNEFWRLDGPNDYCCHEEFTFSDKKFNQRQRELLYDKTKTFEERITAIQLLFERTDGYKQHTEKRSKVNQSSHFLCQC